MMCAFICGCERRNGISFFTFRGGFQTTIWVLAHIRGIYFPSCVRTRHILSSIAFAPHTQDFQVVPFGINRCTSGMCLLRSSRSCSERRTSP